jgi:uncharacterized protein (UPF0303 family)
MEKYDTESRKIATAVSFAYGVISMILLAAKAEKSFQHKYQVDSESFIFAGFWKPGKEIVCFQK